MKNLKPVLSLFVVSVLLVAVGSSNATAKTAEEAYLEGYARMGKAASAWTTQQVKLSQSRAAMMTSMATAQSTLTNARASLMKSVAEVRSSDAKTRQVIEATRSVALDNDLKAVQTFYDKRKLAESYKALNPRKRLNQEALTRLAKAKLPQRLTSYQFEASKGTIIWPSVFRRDEFLGSRMEMDTLLAGRQASKSGVLGENYSKNSKLIAKMRKQLRAIIGDLAPAQYMAARKFLDSLAYEMRCSAAG